MTRAWGIKLGSGGKGVAFCEEHQLVGVGWRNIDTELLVSASRGALAAHVRDTCDWYKTAHQRGRAAGALWRFARECAPGDYVVYYDPAGKRVRICRVLGAVERRSAEGDKPDIWQTRRVEYPCPPIPVTDLPGSLYGRLLSPRGTFWEIRAHHVVEQLANGVPFSQIVVADAGLSNVSSELAAQVVARLLELNPTDWEHLVADYFTAQGATIEGRVGGSQAVIDLAATFSHGELGGERWLVQVKRFQDQKVGWPAVERDLMHAGEEGDHRFCYVSAFGFTAEARERGRKKVHFMEAADFVPFLLGAKAHQYLRPPLRTKLALPAWSPHEPSVAGSP
jgi:predicted Mrr-cat superfamily restriction endonuclease